MDSGQKYSPYSPFSRVQSLSTPEGERAQTVHSYSPQRDLFGKKSQTLDPSSAFTTPGGRAVGVDEGMGHLKKLYERRLIAMSEQIKNTYEKVRNDEILHAMKDDDASKGFVQQRIREIIDETLGNEKEQHIEGLTREILLLRGELEKKRAAHQQEALETSTVVEKYRQQVYSLEAQLTNNSSRARNQEDEISSLRKHLSALSQTCQEALKRKEEEIESRLKRESQTFTEVEAEKKKLFDSHSKFAEELQKQIDQLRSDKSKLLNENQNILREKSDALQQVELMRSDIKRVTVDLQTQRERASRLSSEKEQLENLVRNLNSQLQEAQAELDRIANENDEMSRKYSDYGDQLKTVLQAEQSSSLTTLETLQNKYKQKSKLFKKKISDQKNHIEKLEAEAYQRSRDLEVMGKQAGDYSSQKSDFDAKLKDLKTQHTDQIQRLQTEYQKLLESRVKDIEAKAQEEIAHASKNDHEMKKILSEKMEAMEREYIKKDKHDLIVQSKIQENNTRWETKTKESVEESQMEIRKTLKTAKDEKEAEYEQLVSNLKNDIREMESTLDDARDFNTDVESSLKKERERNHNLQYEVEELEKNKKILVQHLDEASQNIGRLKSMCEEELRKSKSLQSDQKELETKYLGSTVKIDDLQKEIIANKHELQSSKDHIAQLNEEYSASQIRLRSKQQEFDHLKSAHSRLEKEKNDVDSKLQDAMLSMNRESQKFFEESSKLRQEENEKLEQERNQHMLTKNKLRQAEGKIGFLTEELEETDGRLSKAKAQILKQEDDMRDLRSKAYRTDSQSSLQENERAELLKRIELIKRQAKETQERARKFVLQKVQMLRNDLNVFKNSLTIDVHNCQRDGSDFIRDMLTKFKSLDAVNTMKYQSDISDLRRKFHNDITDKQGDILMKTLKYKDDYESKLKITQNELHHVKENYQSQCQRMEELEMMCHKLKNEKMELQGELSSLKTDLRRNTSVLGNLEEEYKSETVKVRKTGDHLIEGAKQEIEKWYKQKLAVMAASVEELRLSCLNELRKTVREVAVLQEEHREEVTTLKQLYETTLSQVENELGSQAGKGHNLADKIARLEDDRQDKEIQYKETVRQLEKKIDRLTKSLTEDTESHSRFKHDKIREIDNLAKHLKETAQILLNKDELIDKLTKERETLKSAVGELRAQNEMKDAHLKIQEQQTLQSKVLKDREIEELQGLIKKSYSRVSNSMDNIKLASRLDAETVELTRKVRRTSGNSRSTSPLPRSHSRSRSNNRKQEKSHERDRSTGRSKLPRASHTRPEDS